MNGNFQWPPLESDPEIFSTYAHKIGLSDAFSFQELFSLDYKDLQQIENPVYAVILSYETNVPLEILGNEIKAPESVPFFMKQSEALDNACGLIAIMHALGHNYTSFNIHPDTIYGKYFNAVKSLNWVDRATVLENSEEFKACHYEFSEQGQSNLLQEQNEVKNHFVCFVFYDGNLVELDGMLNGPRVVKEGIMFEELLDSSIEIVKKRLENQNITENVALMFLSS
jgi:ubiquitin carboxyl-terminal hydrolase L3